MSYHIIDDRGQTIGFSLKPPKWLRKAAKALIPVAAVGATLLIPGVGGALVTGATAAGKAIARVAGSVGGAAVKGIVPSPSIQTLMPAPTTGTLNFPNLSLPRGSGISVPSVSSPPAARSATFPVVPVVLGVGLALLISRR